MHNKKRIPASANIAYQRWEMPDLTGVRRRIAQRLDELKAEEEASASEAAELEEPHIPTPEEILAEREAARLEGFAEGQAQGQLQGYEDGRAQGYAEGEATGQQAGFDAGYQRGLEQARHEVDQQLARLQGLIEQLQGPVARLEHEVEEALLSLVDLVSRAILRREISLDRTFLADVLRESVAALPVGHQRLRIFIHPDDQALAEAACRDLLEDYRLVSDPAITPGGVRVETLQSLVDSTLENRYKKVIDQLLNAGYRVDDSSLKPLPDDVLPTKDTSPLESLAFTEPSTTQLRQDIPDPDHSSAVDPSDPEASSIDASAEELLSDGEEAAVMTPAATEPTRVSLQRGGVPRKLPADAGAAGAAAVPDVPEAVPQDNPAMDAALTDASSVVDEPVDDVVEPAEADEDAFFEQAFDALIQQSGNTEENVAEDGDHAEAELDAFLEGFEENLAAPSLKADSDEAASMDQLEVSEAESEMEEKAWAPESVHDDRYLEDALENAWMDDLESSLKDDELPELPPDQEQQ
ncbi:flagellar assembly protein FliH [Marinospirillum alkaliphilum]|uniref:Flagellar assembly protein FliH n=1 Tax=Marinospirillum alkaliphilum DSM 21637 TaxID=1122209 RepID=A0A1K1VAJ8_9GAMM|nr:flagellar assembly protein FliH [Marinospirillum alkaliphilum]SFX22182.1 Flagellar biosynthesis/type III secretory pathway protein FliH [Marinospirillum alkaliphilum DSM 21637]